ncbi:MAG: NADH-quinone oxidoreductase subunit D, partial [Gaiellaceae bacterium]
MAIAPERRVGAWPIVAPPIYEGTRIPERVPTILDIPPHLRETDDVMRINFGPNHPSTHGVLRLIVDLDGEQVVGLAAVVGYLHTGFEKNMEAKTWWKAITYPPRIDYLSFQYNELVFVLAIEKLLQLEVPEKATWMRTLLCELNRIHSHLVWLGTAALELGAISMFWYCFRERDMILDLYELVTGARMHSRYFQAGGLAEDIPPGFYPECRSFVEWMPKAIDDYESLLSHNQIWLERTRGIGLLSAEDAIALGQSGPVLRASGVD